MAKYVHELPEGFLVRIPDYDHSQIINLGVESMAVGSYQDPIAGPLRLTVETAEPIPLGTSIHWDVFDQDEWVVSRILKLRGDGQTLHELQPMVVKPKKEDDVPEHGTYADEGFYTLPPEDLTHAAKDPDELLIKYRVFREPEDAEQHPAEVQANYEVKNWVHEGTGMNMTDWGAMEEVRAFTFVLKPDTDHHARVALAAYAASIRPFKPQLANELLDVLELEDWKDENGQ